MFDQGKIGKEIASELARQAGRRDNGVIKATVNCEGVASMKKAYCVAAYREIRDQQKLTSYLKLAGPAIDAAGGRVLARGLAAQVYESGIKERTTIIEFDSVEAATELHAGSAHQAALRALADGVVQDLRLVEAVE